MKKGTIIRVFVAPIMIIALAAAAIAAMKFSKPEVKQTDPEEKKWIVQTVSIQNGNFRPEEELIGSVRSSRNQSLRSQITSEIVEIEHHSGEWVKAGERILSLESQDVEANYQSALADLADINAAIEIAKNNHELNVKTLEIEKKQKVVADRELKRKQDMYKRKLILQSEVDMAQSESDSRALRVVQKEIEIRNFVPRLKQLESQRLKIELAVERAKKQFDEATLEAPFTGRLTRVSGQIGQTVIPGQELAYIYDPSQMEIHVQLPLSLANALMTNAITMNQVTGALEVDQKNLPVRLKSMSGTVEKGYASQQGVFVIEEGGSAVTPGQSVSLKVQIAPVANSFLIPELALFEDGRVYRKNADDRLESIDVTVVGTKHLDKPYYLVTSDKLNDQDQLMITRLSNAISGLLTTSVEEAAAEKAKKLAEKKKKEQEENGDVPEEDSIEESDHE